MRKLARPLATVIAGGLIATLGWHVATAAPSQTDTLSVCQRPGADLRSPNANGTCPSGYTLVEITETPPAPTTTTTTTIPPAPDPVIAYNDFGLKGGSELANDGIVARLDLPAGAYTLVATGEMANNSPGSQVVCQLLAGGIAYDQADLTVAPGTVVIDGAMSGVADLAQPASVVVRCGQPTGAGGPTSQHYWQVTATEVDEIHQS